MNAICIASGPSLTQEDVNLCKNSGHSIYIVNDVYKLAPWADHLYAADRDWWDFHEGVQDFPGQKWHIDEKTCEKWGLNYIPYSSSKIFATESPIATGKNSGFQAINLAFLHGHREIWLLGYDLGFQPGTKKHFFGEHPQKINRPSQYDDWLAHYAKAKPIMEKNGLRIINMTNSTRLDIFEKGRWYAWPWG